MTRFFAQCIECEGLEFTGVGETTIQCEKCKYVCDVDDISTSIYLTEAKE